MSGVEKVALGIATGIIGVATLAVLVSPKSSTQGVLQSMGGALSQSLTAAEGATGTGTTPNA